MLTNRKVVMLLAAASLTIGGCKKTPEGTPEAQKPVITLSHANFAPSSTLVCVQMEHWKEQLELPYNGPRDNVAFSANTTL
ncbi:MAG: hypothetical protein AB7F23_05795 [Phycisphaerae bacterium]|jgi:hypothetical protein